MNKINKKMLDCGNCNSKKSVEYILKDLGDCISAEVKKCTNCNYQYGLKELFKLNNRNAPNGN